MRQMLSFVSTTVRRMASSSASTRRSMVAICQMTSDNELEQNWKTAKEMIERANERQCKMIFFPECFDFIGRTKEEQVTLAMEEKSEFIGRFRELANRYNMWMSLGGFHHKDGEHLPWNTHLVLNSSGETAAQYHKLHLFDLEIPGKVRLMESEFSKAGVEMVPPVQTPIGNLGLSICYDLRFPELSIWNRKQGAQILSFPSAFTLNTGLAHWESLLRARAIENQCYVVAAAQTGKHNDKRMSYGHAMVVDPWGAVIAQCSERIGMCFAEIDLDYVDELRVMQPVYAHRRSDLYSLYVNQEKPGKAHNIIHEVYLVTESLNFGGHPIAPSCVFYRSAHSYAFVNLKPVLNGHVLVSPVRGVEQLTDLNDEETADLFITAKKVQTMLVKHHQTDSCTVCVQDGPHSGQTVKHVHVHILPRKAGDFGGSTDSIYKELADHDKDAARKPRSLEEMSSEADVYRKAIKSI